MVSEFEGNALSRAVHGAADGLVRITRDAADAETRRLRGAGSALDRATRDLRAADGRNARRLESVTGLRPPDRSAPLPSDGRRYPVYAPSEAELELGSRRLVSEHPLSESLTRSPSGEPTLNTVQIWVDDTGRMNIYKPFEGELHNGHDWLPTEPGALANRELAGYRVINMFAPGRPLVPTTALIEDGPRGPGMLQEFVPLKPSKKWSDYRRVDRQTGAVGHHIIGNYDGHEGNMRPRYDGSAGHHRDDDMVLFDHGYSFPESPDHTRGSNGFSYGDSKLVTAHYRYPNFDPAVIRSVAAVRPEQIGSAIQDLVSDNAVQHVLRKHAAFLRFGTIKYI